MEPTQAKPSVSVLSNGRRDTVGQEKVKALKALLPFISTDETRWALQFIHVSDDGEFCEATDGHKAIRLPRVDVSADLLPGTCYRPVKDAGGFVLLPHPDAAASFPPIARILPGPAHNATWYFKAPVAPRTQTQGTLLCTIGKAGLYMDAAILGAVPEGQWAFWGKGEFSPVRADRTDKDGWTVVLMPMRADGPTDFTPPKAPEAPAPDVTDEEAAAAPQWHMTAEEEAAARASDPDPIKDGTLAGPEVVAQVVDPAPPCATPSPCAAYLAALEAAKRGVKP